MSERDKQLESIAGEFGTPFWVIDAGKLRSRIRSVLAMSEPAGVQARFAMKSCSATRVLQEMRAHGIWLDTVSGNEVLRGLQAGYTGGFTPPEIFLTCDVLRDNSLAVLLEHNILPNLGSPGMLDDLAQAGYTGPLAIRVNPGFGHGHVNACDTGGPSSKHGVWLDEVAALGRKAVASGMQPVMLHAHIGSGPRFEELLANLNQLTGDFARLVAEFPDLEAVSLGGGIPHDYSGQEPPIDEAQLCQLFAGARSELSKLAGRELRLEIEPGRYFTAPAAMLVTRVHDIKSTRSNEKSEGARFAMVDAGFTDLVRPAMYGSYHSISVVGTDRTASEDYVVAGPLCESGDVFTQDADAQLRPRKLPKLERGDLLFIHDAGAYGYSMSSNYNSLGRAPQIWLEEDGSTELISRRETVDDILRLEREL